MFRAILVTGAVCLFGIALSAQTPVGEVFATGASVRGSIVLAGNGTQVLSGSQVAAGTRPAVLKLTRGGEVKICPKTNVAVSASKNSRTLLFSMSEGEIEFHFDATESDVLQTPDFRVLVVGPGRVDVAMCADARGGLSLRSSSPTSLLVTEMMGDGNIQVPGNSSVDFRNGSVASGVRDSGKLCGCAEPPPIPEQTPVVAKEEPPPPPPPPVMQPPETHIEVDAPFIFRGDDPNPDMMYTLAKMQTNDVVNLSLKLQPTVMPPPEPAPKPVAAPAPEKKKDERAPSKNPEGGFFKKMGRFFGKLFGR